MGYKTRSNYPSIEVPKPSFLNQLVGKKWTWWKLKKPDCIDNWTFGHFLAGCISGIVTATFSPILGSAMLLFLIAWEWLDFFVSINFNINVKYLFDRGGFSPSDIGYDITGYYLTLTIIQCVMN